MLPDPTLCHLLIEATRNLLLSGVPLRQATMDRLATQLRISKKTIYRQFISKESLVGALLAEHLGQTRALGRWVDQASTAEVGLARLTSWQATQVSEVSVQLVTDLRTQYPALSRPWWTTYQREFYDLLTACLRRGIAERLFRPNLDAEVLGRLLLAQLEWLADGQLFPAERFAPRRIYEQLMQHFLQGLKRYSTGL
ncbi:TetR/AcrR family transcriptional regulator [Hymenobacter sp. GOD-10R]|uniref:TetR/AcrR family transcriptional regulator n=1 Tax=Hymenobacter sp. GOD-10R TaxID=3093922 RepID=UPI002D76ABE9|nr:TetR/AcrR family transcriptional regulator [Hymenobacter sp. GOD-10R]WRQ31874.1 TetR/AcrR family transcriptional regulator [Hymenobacter sp. GOD-10R]